MECHHAIDKNEVKLLEICLWYTAKLEKRKLQNDYVLVWSDFMFLMINKYMCIYT